MTTHIVRANNGFISAPMSRIRANSYANQLRMLGNYDVEVAHANTQNHRHTSNP